MKYISTRDVLGSSEYTFIDAILEGLAPDGGLFVPQSVPQISSSEWKEWKTMKYTEICFALLRKFISYSEIDDSDLKKMIHEAYKTFSIPEVTKLVQTDPHLYVMELFHGPTFAFKDVALQLLGQIFDYALKQKNTRMTILGATSGDTGSAAIAGVKGRSNIDCVILFPLGKTSKIQETQMTSNLDPNIHCLAVKNSDFDDCQSIVKACFNDPRFNEEMSLGAVNSINWARILTQICYYVYTAAQLSEQISFVVPTGNFGDILAGYYAKKMGLPIELVIASNHNDILPRFFETGEYKITGPVQPSLSPSMDIAVSSNFERFLFDLFERNGATIVEKFSELTTKKTFNVSESQLIEARKTFTAYSISENETMNTIKSVFNDHGYLLCPHSAVGYAAAIKYRLAHPEKTIVTLATAHIGKFTEDVLTKLDDAKLRDAVKNSVPSELLKLANAKTRRFDIDNNVEAVKKYLRENLAK